MRHNNSKRRRKRRDDDFESAHMAHDDSNWLVSYADMMTLLFGFFVLMYSFSKIDEDKFEVVRKDLVKYFGGQLKESEGASNLKKNIEAQVSQMMGEGGFNDQFKIKTSANMIQMSFESSVVFPAGSAELTAKSANLIDQISHELKNVPIQEIEIEGHTDIDGINSVYFPSNWELSSARASRIVRRIVENGFDEKKMVAVGYGASRPEFPHVDEKGQIIDENKAKNRRVVLNIYLKPDSSLSSAEIQKMGFRTVAAEDIETEDVKNKKELDIKNADIKVKLEEAQKRYKEMTAKLKAAKELEKSMKQMDELTKKTEEIERKVQSIEIQKKDAITNENK